MVLAKLDVLPGLEKVSAGGQGSKLPVGARETTENVLLKIGGGCM